MAVDSENFWKLEIASVAGRTQMKFRASGG